jgi:hypothetical protein
MASRRSTLLTAAALIASTTALLPASQASAATYTMTVVSPVVGAIGIDAIYEGGSGGPIYDVPPCALSGPQLGWNSSGQLVGTRTVPNSIPGLGSITKVRFEMYPGECGTYDPWAGNVGGVHFESSPWVSNMGQIRMPVDGVSGAFRIDGDVLSSTPITEGRVKVVSFQIATGYPDAPMPLQQNGTVAYGAFASSLSVGDQWTAGVGWAGRYIVFVTDLTTGRKLHSLVNITSGDIPTIDLDAICFGFDTCRQDADSPPPVPGDFYPMTPTRILDTRTGLGIVDGPVRSGDGRNSDPNPVKRRAEAANHELKITGHHGIPDSGVAAVLLNVTAVNAPRSGYISIVPKPPRVGNVFSDQGSFGAYPSTSNLNVDSPDATPNMVLARVGAGGKIRIYNPYGPTHIIADVAGWFGTDGRYNDGSGFKGLVPKRLMDSRHGIGGPAERFGAWEVRYLKVAGVAGVPENAESVVLNITTDAPGGVGNYATAFPKGEPVPNASNVNGRVNGARANLAVVKVGADGYIGVRSVLTSTNMIIDVFGSFGPYGKAVTTIVPVRSIDSRTGLGTEQRSLGSGETRSLLIRGRAGVPANATAVVINLTSTNSISGGYFTAFPSNAEKPMVSSVNFEPNQTVPNLVMIKLGPDGAIKLFNDRGRSHFIIDVMGYVT